VSLLGISRVRRPRGIWSAQRAPLRRHPRPLVALGLIALAVGLALAGLPARPPTVAAAPGAPRADVYLALDVTGSMSAADITALKTAVNTFIDELGLDPTDPSGPQIGIGRYLGERCARTPNPPLNNYGNLGRGDPTRATNYVSYHNYTATTNGWCDQNDEMPNLSADPNPASPPRSTTTSSPAPWNNYYPGAGTPSNGQFGQSTANAHGAVNNIDAGIDNNCSTFQWTAPPSLNPYGACDIISATSHTAGLATANLELTSSRARGTPIRKVLILQTDGTVCTTQTAYTQLTPAQSTIRTHLPTANLPPRTSSATRSENRAMALANYMKHTTSVAEGVEIYTILFWDDDGNNTCWDNSVFDVGTSLMPGCGPNNGALPDASARSHVDDYLIAISSSAPGTCDHYQVADKRNPASLTSAYLAILQRLVAETGGPPTPTPTLPPSPTTPPKGLPAPTLTSTPTATPTLTPTVTPSPTATSTRTSTSTPMATPSATPSPTPSPTATAPPAACAPRPSVGITAVPGGGGRLLVTVTAGTNASTSTNQIVRLAVGPAVNGVVYADGVAQPTSFTITPPAGATSYSFQVARLLPGQAATVPLVVTDRCGDWSTFVGGGPGAF
jgi:hypothetical protein